jgi:hypothetical protein
MTPFGHLTSPFDPQAIVLRISNECIGLFPSESKVVLEVEGQLRQIDENKRINGTIDDNVKRSFSEVPPPKLRLALTQENVRARVSNLSFDDFERIVRRVALTDLLSVAVSACHARVRTHGDEQEKVMALVSEIIRSLQT